MKTLRDSHFTDRLGTAAKARAAQLEKARAALEANKVGAEDRAKQRAAVATAREERRAVAAAAKLADAERLKAQRMAEEESRLAAERAEIEARARKKEEDRAKLAQILVDQKAARDARYAARKQRGARK